MTPLQAAVFGTATADRALTPARLLTVPLPTKPAMGPTWKVRGDSKFWSGIVPTYTRVSIQTYIYATIWNLYVKH